MDRDLTGPPQFTPLASQPSQFNYSSCHASESIVRQLPRRLNTHARIHQSSAKSHLHDRPNVAFFPPWPYQAKPAQGLRSGLGSPPCPKQGCFRFTWPNLLACLLTCLLTCLLACFRSLGSRLVRSPLCNTVREQHRLVWATYMFV